MDEWTDLDEAYLAIFGEHPDFDRAAPGATDQLAAWRASAAMTSSNDVREPRGG